MDPIKPGYTTTEGAAALIAIAGPLVAAIASLRGWPLVAVLGIVAVVACVYIVSRTRLKSGAAAVLALAFLPLVGCATGGHYETRPPRDINACIEAPLRAAKAQAPCDVSPPPPAVEIIACATAAAVEMAPCLPTWVWVPDPVTTPVTTPVPAVPVPLKVQ